MPISFEDQLQATAEPHISLKVVQEQEDEEAWTGSVVIRQNKEQQQKPWERSQLKDLFSPLAIEELFANAPEKQSHEDISQIYEDHPSFASGVIVAEAVNQNSFDVSVLVDDTLQQKEYPEKPVDYERSNVFPKSELSFMTAAEEFKQLGSQNLANESLSKASLSYSIRSHDINLNMELNHHSTEVPFSMNVTEPEISAAIPSRFFAPESRHSILNESESLTRCGSNRSLTAPVNSSFNTDFNEEKVLRKSCVSVQSSPSKLHVLRSNYDTVTRERLGALIDELAYQETEAISSFQQATDEKSNKLLQSEDEARDHADKTQISVHNNESQDTSCLQANCSEPHTAESSRTACIKNHGGPTNDVNTAALNNAESSAVTSEDKDEASDEEDEEELQLCCDRTKRQKVSDTTWIAPGVEVEEDRPTSSQKNMDALLSSLHQENTLQKANLHEDACTPDVSQRLAQSMPSHNRPVVNGCSNLQSTPLRSAMKRLPQTTMNFTPTVPNENVIQPKPAEAAHDDLTVSRLRVNFSEVDWQASSSLSGSSTSTVRGPDFISDVNTVEDQKNIAPATAAELDPAQTDFGNKSVFIELPTEIIRDVRKVVRAFPPLNDLDTTSEIQSHPEKNHKKLVSDQSRFYDNTNISEYTFDTSSSSEIQDIGNACETSFISTRDKSRLASVEQAFEALKDELTTDSIVLDEKTRVIVPPSPAAPKHQLLELLDSFDSLTTVELDISGKKLNSVFAVRNLFPNLQTLDLNDNELVNLKGLPETLISLKLARNRISEVTSFTKLTNLHYLDLSFNSLKTFESLKSLVHLRELFVNSCGITNVDHLCALSGILKLSIKSNSITSLRDSKGEMLSLPCLTDLYLSDNKIEKLCDISGMPCLKVLHMDGNMIRAIEPRTIHHNLIELYLQNNQAQSFRTDAFPSLEVLDLTDNILQGDAFEGAGRYMRKLKVLKIGNQNTSNQTLVFDFRQFRDCTEIYAKGLPLKYLDHFAGYFKLTSLEVANCEITKIPDVFHKMAPNLTWLNLSRNKIGDMTPLARLHRLRHLDLHGNDIREITPCVAALRQLKKLEVLDFRFNPVSAKFYPASSTCDIDKMSGRTWVDQVENFISQLNDAAFIRRLCYRSALIYLLGKRLRMFDGLSIEKDDRIQAEKQYLRLKQKLATKLIRSPLIDVNADKEKKVNQDPLNHVADDLTKLKVDELKKNASPIKPVRSEVYWVSLDDNRKQSPKKPPKTFLNRTFPSRSRHYHTECIVRSPKKPSAMDSACEKPSTKTVRYAVYSETGRPMVLTREVASSSKRTVASYERGSSIIGSAGYGRVRSTSSKASTSGQTPPYFPDTLSVKAQKKSDLSLLEQTLSLETKLIRIALGSSHRVEDPVNVTELDKTGIIFKLLTAFFKENPRAWALSNSLGLQQFATMCAMTGELQRGGSSKIKLLYHGAHSETLMNIMYSGTHGYPVYGKKFSDSTDISRLAFADQCSVADVFARDPLQKSHRVVLSLVQMNRIYPTELTFGEFYAERDAIVQQAKENGCDGISLKPSEPAGTGMSPRFLSDEAR